MILQLNLYYYQVCSIFSKYPTVAGGKQRNVMAFEGSVRIKTESVKEHEGSPVHKHAQILAELERKSQPDVSSSGVSSSGVHVFSSEGATGTLDAQFRASKEGELDALEKLFRMAYWLARQELAHRYLEYIFQQLST
jgi:hypothetical protein